MISDFLVRVDQVVDRLESALSAELKGCYTVRQFRCLSQAVTANAYDDAAKAELTEIRERELSREPGIALATSSILLTHLHLVREYPLEAERCAVDSTMLRSEGLPQLARAAALAQRVSIQLQQDQLRSAEDTFTKIGRCILEERDLKIIAGPILHLTGEGLPAQWAERDLDLVAMRHLHPVGDALLRGRKSYSSAKYLQAIEAFKEGRAMVPGDSVEAVIERGVFDLHLARTLYRLNQISEASRMFERLERLFARYPTMNAYLTAVHGRGDVARQLSDYPEARERYSLILREAPPVGLLKKAFHAYLGLAALELVQGSLSESKRHLDEADRTIRKLGKYHQKDKCSIWRGRASYALHSDSIRGFTDAWRRAVELSPSDLYERALLDSSLRHDLAWYHIRHNQFDEARRHIDTAMTQLTDTVLQADSPYAAEYLPVYLLDRHARVGAYLSLLQRQPLKCLSTCAASRSYLIQLNVDTSRMRRRLVLLEGLCYGLINDLEAMDSCFETITQTDDTQPSDRVDRYLNEFVTRDSRRRVHSLLMEIALGILRHDADGRYLRYTRTLGRYLEPWLDISLNSGEEPLGELPTGAWSRMLQRCERARSAGTGVPSPEPHGETAKLHGPSSQTIKPVKSLFSKEENDRMKSMWIRVLGP